ncbi:MAG: hypothetical protein K0U47_00895 [Epsilonproteobacteria bacterium]|nr:hypothetical protein [Campylobacterota bacterium]
MRILLVTTLLASFLMSETYYSYGKKVELTKLKESRAVDQNSSTSVEYYQNSAGQKIGVTKEVLAKCSDTQACENIFKTLNLNNRSNLTSSIILITLENGENPFEIANKLYLNEAIEFAHPNFVKERKSR